MVESGSTRLNDVWVFRLGMMTTVSLKEAHSCTSGPPSQDLEELEQKAHELLSEFARRTPSMPGCEEHVRHVLEAIRKAK